MSAQEAEAALQGKTQQSLLAWAEVQKMLTVTVPTAIDTANKLLDEAEAAIG